MSRHGEITFAWGDEDYTFRLGIGELRDLQERCDAGPLVIADRLRNGTWRVDDIRETIRLGLIGGGMTPVKALTLVKKYVDEWPLADNAIPAWAILSAAINGVPEEKVGKKAAAKPKAGSLKTASFVSPPSTALVQ